MAKRIRFSFAINGDRVAVNDETQSSGVLSYQQGYGAPYSADIQTDPTARRINRDRFNQVMNDITDNIKEWQEQLFPDYIDPASNGNSPFSYSKGMIVINSGDARVSLVDSNTQAPTGANWADAFPFPVALGGTGAENAADARSNLGLTGSYIISQGSNANGNYIRYSDGMIVQWGSVASPVTNGANQSFNFPVAYTNFSSVRIFDSISGVNPSTNPYFAIGVSSNTQGVYVGNGWVSVASLSWFSIGF